MPSAKTELTRQRRRRAVGAAQYLRTQLRARCRPQFVDPAQYPGSRRASCPGPARLASRAPPEGMPERSRVLARVLQLTLRAPLLAIHYTPGRFPVIGVIDI